MTIRAYDPQDHPSLATLYDVAQPLGIGIPDAENSHACRLVTETEAGRLIGYGAASGGAASSVTLVIHPDHQRQGLGTSLWERLRRELNTLGTNAVEAWVRQENVSGVAWLQKNGFTQIHPDGPVQLLLADADLEQCQRAWENAAAQKITLTTLAEEKTQDPEYLAKLHALYSTFEADIPPFETFAQEWNAPGKLLFLAKDGERYIGLSTADPRGADPYFAETNDIFQQHLTGVLPEYRRRGLATALKSHVIAYAKRAGYRTLWTHSGNPDMRALNWKLGFRTGPWLIYSKTFVQEITHV